MASYYRDTEEKVRQEIAKWKSQVKNSSWFESYEDKPGEYRWRFFEDGNKYTIIAKSSEGYKQAQKRDQAIASSQQNAPGAEIDPDIVDS